MGFSVAYQTTRPVTPAEAEAITRDAEAAARGRSWLSCEPVCFYGPAPADEAGGPTPLMGSSKPNFSFGDLDVESAEESGEPDGTLLDVLDILCTLSRDHGVDWEISHEADPEPAGLIHAGVCDDQVKTLFETLAELSATILENGDESGDD